MRRILANLSLRQRITIAATAIVAAAALYALVHWRREADFRPLFSGLAPEDAAAVVQKLKEGGADYRLAENGGSILAPSARLAELRLTMAASGLPKSGRIGFELFDKANLGATEFAEHVNYRRALEGELERSIMSLAEVELARVHLTFPKESIYLEERQPAKASVLLRLRPGAGLTPRNVLAIDHLVASAVEGLAPDAVSVVDMNGNLLGRPKAPSTLDGPEASEAGLDYRRKLEADLVAKIGSTLEPLLGAERFRVGASVECDFTGGEQSEEIFDPARSVMVNSQRTEDSSDAAASSGVPGTASSLPRPSSRPGRGSGRVSRVTENITYQTSRTVKKTRMPAGTVRRISVAVLVDQAVNWEKDKGGFRRVLVPPTPEKLKIVRDLVAGIAGFNLERGDQLMVETLPFENTLLAEPPQASPPAPRPAAPAPLALDRKTLLMVGGAVLGLLILAASGVLFLRRRRAPEVEATTPAALPPGDAAPAPAIAGGQTVEQQIEATLAEREALQKRMDAQALNALKLTPVITKTAEVLAKHLRDKVKQDPDTSAQILRAWIREEES
ncbi:MAG: flagellar M-ring protein FliF [Acidobacteriia bacterium]|nr:flagellar M-ring protein FliF [Terriglobia bacterium]